MAWYAGGEGGFNLPRRIAQVIDHYVRKTGLKPLIMGGSGGGFATVNVMQYMQEPAMGFIFNPQTSISDYNEQAVRQYIEAAIPSALPTLPAKEIFDQFNVDHDIRNVELKGKSFLVYLQNESDWHADQHMTPFMAESGDWKKLTPITFISEVRRIIVQLGNWGSGHVAPPRQLIQSIISCMIEATSQTDAMSALAKTVPEAVSSPVIKDTPSNITFEAEAYLGEGKVEVTVSSFYSPSEVSFAFYLLEDGVRTATKWYSYNRVVTFTTDIRNNARLKVVVFARSNGENPVIKTIPVRETMTVAIFGSCVTADAIYGHNYIKLAGYIARSSLASQVSSAAVDKKVLACIASPFQKRMVEADMKKSLWPLVESNKFDYLLVDFIDERFNLAKISSDDVITLSSEYISGAEAAKHSLKNVDILDRYSELKWDLWVKGWDRLFKTLKDSGDIHKLVVNRVFYANMDKEGQPLEGSPFSEENAELERYYSYIETNAPDVHFIDYPKNLFVSDLDHKWGVSPFHYASPLYEHTSRQLRILSAM